MEYIPEILGTYRNHFLEVPSIINQASGIRIFGKLIKSLVFTTDVAVVRNINANAVISVYPFTPQPTITHAIIQAAEMPVFCGVGGGITTGKRTINIAQDAEFQGAMGVVVNAPTSNDVITQLNRVVDIPIVVTVVSEYTDFEGRLAAGASILNVSGAQNTPNIVKFIRDRFPRVPIMATGGQSDDSIKRTIDAGANAITYTPPACGDIIKQIMNSYRDKCETNHAQVWGEE